MMRIVRLGFLLLLACLSLPASAQVMVVALLGTGTPQPQIDRFGAAVLVEAGHQRLLFDAGRGVAQRLYQLGKSYNDIDKVFITHLHYDHLLGLPDLLLSGWVFQRRRALRVWGPTGIAEHLHHLHKAYHADIHFRRAHTDLPSAGITYQAQTVQPGLIYDHQGVRVTAIEVDHHPVHPAFGYRVDYAKRSVIISGDTRYTDNIARQPQPVDLLIHEIADAPAAMLERNPRLRAVMSYHSRPQDLARLVSILRPRLTVMTHPVVFQTSTEELIKRASLNHNYEVIMGADLMCFDLSDSIRRYDCIQ